MGSLYTKDGEDVKWKEGDYSTDFYTDQLIENIERHRSDGKPFFAFAAYTSPHWPLQVDAAYWSKYVGMYDEGYEALKERRMENLKRSGLIPQEAVLPRPHPSVTRWNALNPEQKRIEARKMELFAGMVDNLDFNVGRLIRYLKNVDEFDNTLVVFMSDNGAAPSDLFFHPVDGPFIRKHFTYDYEAMGASNSFVSYGPGWAEAGSAPFRFFKFLTSEGGMVAPMIISGPGVERHSEIYHGFATVMDLAPTFYDYAKTKYPNRFHDRDVYPLRGRSLFPLLSNSAETAHPADYVFGLEHNGNVMIRKGDWKLVNVVQGDLLAEVARDFPKNFELYDLSKDLAERNDLKVARPGKLAEMILEWERFSEEIHLVPGRARAE